ncbi:unnamed protein product [Pylaiella littoralis]
MAAGTRFMSTREVESLACFELEQFIQRIKPAPHHPLFLLSAHVQVVNNTFFPLGRIPRLTGDSFPRPRPYKRCRSTTK